jgi:hypothetical protein
MAGVGQSWIGPLAAALVIAVGMGPSAPAQQKASGSLAGRLTDWYATPLEGATVILRNQETGSETRTTTAKNGAYRFTSLGAGEYTLEAESPKLGQAHVDGIIVSAGHEARVLAAMQFLLPTPKPIQAAFHDMEPPTHALATTLPAEQLQALPLTGRRWQDFEPETPTTSTAAGGSAPTSLRGAGQLPVATTVDGATTTLAFGGAGRYGPGGSGLHGPAMSQSAIREVQTAAGNVEAEGDRAAGGRMEIETMRGTNALHGQAFGFDRQNTWGAKNPFSQWVKETAPATELTVPVFTPEAYTPPDNEVTWGIGMGGRIRRDKLFWFGALDGYQRNDPGLSMVKHPYLCANPPQCTEQTGFFAQPSDPQMQVLSARMGQSNNPVAAGLAAYSPMLETLAGLLGPAPRTATQWVGFSRIDWEATERHHFTLEGTGALWNSPGGGLTRVSETYGNHSFGMSHATEEWLLGRWEAFLTPNLLAVSQGSWGHDILSERPDAPSAFEKPFLNPSVNSWGQLPQIVVDNRYGLTIGNPSRFGQGNYPDEHLYQGQETVDWVHRGLLMKAGFALNHNTDATSMLRNQTGTYSYENAVNFTSDEWAFANGVGELDPDNQHNCDPTGKGFGNLPCYSYYSQTLGPNDWQLGTNDWAGFATAQWQPAKRLVLSAGLRWEREQLPPPIAALANPELPLAGKLPSLGNNWGPRASLALGTGEGHWPVLRMGYGMYYARTENSTVETVLTQTGSPNGDLSVFMRPIDDLPNYGGGAPPFPNVLTGLPSSVVKPDAEEFAPNFRNPEVHQGVAAIEETLPGHVQLTGSAMVSLGRRLPVFIDTNIDTAAAGTITYAVVDATGQGPIKTQQIAVPFYASWPLGKTSVPGSVCQPNQYGIGGWCSPDYQQVDQFASRANSTYEAAMFRIERYDRSGLSLHAHYTYSHAMDWNPNQTPLEPGPAGLGEEYGTSDQDVRHSAAVMAVYEPPWKLQNWAGKLGNGWMLSGIGQFRGGLPYTMRVAGSLPECVISAGESPCTPPATGAKATTGELIFGLRPGMNGSGGDNRVFGLGNGTIPYNIGRNTFRYPSTWKADMRVSKHFELGHMRQLELMGESFNLFNHQNVTELETTGYYIEAGSPFPTLNFLTGPYVGATGTIQKPNTTAFGQPLNINATNFYRERQFQFGLRLRF